MGPIICILPKEQNQKAIVGLVRLRERRKKLIMEKFKSYIAEQKNTHMTHLEDRVIYGGVNGTRQAINALRELRDMLAGQHQGSVSVKWDGCVHENTILFTNYGEITIKEVVENYHLYPDLKVKGKDISDNTVTMTPVIATNSSSGTKPWVEVLTENGGALKLTADHEVHTSNRGWVKAEDLIEGDDITEIK